MVGLPVDSALARIEAAHAPEATTNPPARVTPRPFDLDSARAFADVFGGQVVIDGRS